MVQYTVAILNKVQARLDKLYDLTQAVSAQVAHLDTRIDRGFSTILHALQETKARSPTDSLVQKMPLKPRIFYGRDDLVHELALLLVTEGTSRICILGPGGMGKTSSRWMS